MNREQYKSDSRYAKILEQMDLLNIMDISTTRQSKNGTIVWKLPIKSNWNKKCLEYASFNSGYVRNQGVDTDRSWQINKTNKSFVKEFPNNYKYYSTERILIPIEIDRLEYMLKYVIKNEFIKNANMITI